MTDQFFDPDAETNAGDATRWMEVRRSPKRRTPGVVLSVRVGPEILQALSAFARKQNMSVSEAARECLTAFVPHLENSPLGIVWVPGTDCAKSARLSRRALHR